MGLHQVISSRWSMAIAMSEYAISLNKESVSGTCKPPKATIGVELVPLQAKRRRTRAFSWWTPHQPHGSTMSISNLLLFLVVIALRLDDRFYPIGTVSLGGRITAIIVTNSNTSVMGAAISRRAASLVVVGSRVPINRVGVEDKASLVVSRTGASLLTRTGRSAGATSGV